MRLIDKCGCGLLLGLVGGLSVAYSGPAAGGENVATTRPSIQYIRSQIPAVRAPVVKGERYEDLVPDTLDIQERCALALNALTSPLDEAADYELYVWADFFHNPPVLVHDFSDWCQVKFMEALPLLRVASGSHQNEQVDQVWMDVLLKSLGP